jgi:hypothetical protein
MALTTGEQVRLLIQDQFRYDTETIVGDGTASAFKLRQGLPHSQLSASSTAMVATTAGWSATGATIDHRYGRVIFSGVISANSAVNVGYYWSVFSEDEIGHYTAIAGSVNGAAREAIRALMVNYAKRGKWAAPDGSNYDDTMAMQNLKTIYDDLVSEDLGSDSAPEGGAANWPEEQTYWGY